jgi:hypothetical protein
MAGVVGHMGHRRRAGDRLGGVLGLRFERRFRHRRAAVTANRAI